MMTMVVMVVVIVREKLSFLLSYVNLFFAFLLYMHCTRHKFHSHLYQLAESIHRLSLFSFSYVCFLFFIIFLLYFPWIKKIKKKTEGMKRGKKWKLVRSTRVERHRHRDLGQALGSHKPCDLIWSWWRRSDDVDHNDDDCCRLSSSAQAGLTKVMKGGAGGQ